MVNKKRKSLKNRDTSASGSSRGTSSSSASNPLDFFTAFFTQGPAMVNQKGKPIPPANLFKEPLRFFNDHILYLNNSKFFAGVVMIMLNIGSKYITVNLSKHTESYLKYDLSKQLLIFSMSWMGTRDIYASLILTAVFVILSDHLFNEKSNFCVLSNKSLKKVEKAMDTNGDGVVSHEELNSAIVVLEKAKKEKEWQHMQRMQVANGMAVVKA